MTTLYILALDGLMDSSLSITLDLAHSANAFAQALAGVQWSIVRLAPGSHITTAHGMTCPRDLDLDSARRKARRGDWIVIPGMNMSSPSRLTRRLAADDARAAADWLAGLPAGVNIAASCSSVFLLAEAGLLSGRHVTTTWWLAHLLRQRVPEVQIDEARMLVADGRFLTAGSAYAHLDLMLALIAQCLGSSVAQQCSKYLLVDQRPSQARYMAPDLMQHMDPTIAAAERWIDEHLCTPLRVTELASHLALTPRTLSRRIQSMTGLSPVALIRRRRLLHATHLLQTTDLPIEAIAGRVGYQDSTPLRKLMKQTLGVNPTGLR